MKLYTRDQFDDPPQLAKYLASELRKKRLALVLGSGIGWKLGLPGWEDLLKGLFRQKGVPYPHEEQDLKAIAEYFKKTHCGGNTKTYLRAVADALYDTVRCDIRDLRSNDTLASIGSLIMASRRGAVSNVITLNYDNMLEMYLRYHGFVVRSIHSESHWASYSDVEIFHPHGFLPYKEYDKFSQDIVFDQNSYEMFKDDRFWRKFLSTLLRRHSCLFIGIRGTDANLNSLLSETKPSHPSVQDNVPYWGITFTTKAEPVRKLIWEERGVFVKQIATWDDLPPFLFSICQCAADMT